MQHTDAISHGMVCEDEVTPNEYRECAIMFLGILQPAIAHVLSARNQSIGYCQILFALGLEDGSMRDAAARLCVDVKCISDGARRFVRENGLPTPACMKSEAASKRYSESRNRRLSA